MSEYYAVVREGADDHLEHLFGFGSRKGFQKANHKYIARVQVGNGWKYFYSTAELAAYKAGGAAKSAAKTIGGTADGALSKIRRFRLPGTKRVSKDHAKNAKALRNFLNASREADKASSSRKTKSNPFAGAASKASKAVSGASKAAGNAASTASKVLNRAKKVKISNPIKITTGEEARKAIEKRRKEREKMFSSSDYKTTTKKFGPLTIRVSRKKKK